MERQHDLPAHDRRGYWTRAEVLGLGLLTAFTVVALVGFGLFGRNPALLAVLPSGLGRFYGVAFGFFAQAQIILAGIALLVVLRVRAGWRWVPALLLVYGISLVSELSGTRFGIPFGAYSYGEQLGPRWFGLVPALIPLSWFLMAIPSYALAGHVVSGGALGRLLAGSLVLLAWDLSLDPAMSYVTRYWVWAETGPYYGMPVMNLIGWYVTGLALMGALHAVRAGEWLAAIPTRFLGAYYAVNLLLPLGMNAAAGLAGAVVAGIVPVVLFVAITSGRSSARRIRRPEAGSMVLAGRPGSTRGSSR